MTYALTHEKRDTLPILLMLSGSISSPWGPGSEAPRTTKDPQPARDPKRRLLRLEEWLCLAANSPRVPTPWKTVYHYSFRQWRIDATFERLNAVLREHLRICLGRKPRRSRARA
jgi:hypothetical protein